MLLLSSGLCLMCLPCPKPAVFINCPLQCIWTCIFFAPVECWNLSLETWTSTKALSSVDDCPRQCSPGAPGTWPRGVEPVTGYHQYWGLSAYYLIYKWETFLLGPLADGARFHNSHRGTFVCRIFVVEMGTIRGHLVLSWCWCHSPYEFTFIEIFIFSYSFRLLSSVISIDPAGLPWPFFLQSRSSDIELPQLLFIWECLNFSLTP